MTGTILFVDNDVDFLNTRSEFLERAGYDMLKATTLSEAEWPSRNANIHLAIFDIRMRDDDDEHDKSGLALAQQAAFYSVPKIILTDHAFYDAVREALRQQPGGSRIAIDVIRKEDGHEALIAATRSAFDEHVLINWNLKIDWQSCDVFSLTRSVMPELEGQPLLNFVSEFQDVFRRLFHQEEEIRVDRLLWERENRVAVVVLTSREGVKPESFVVVCGQNATVNEETQRFEEFAPRAPGETHTRLNANSETIHFAANAYTFAENDLEKVQTLDELYRIAPSKTFKGALHTLFQKTLFNWHQDKPFREEFPLDHLYRHRLKLQNDSRSVAHLDETINSLGTRVSTLGLKMERHDGKAAFHFHGQSFYFMDPVLFLMQVHTPGATLVVNVPGTLTGKNILADDVGHTWLTDFVDAGVAPLSWNHVVLESAIRFDWPEAVNFFRWHEMEQCLINTDFAKPDIRDLEPVVRKSAQAISALRKLMARPTAQDVLDYHLGMFFQAARRLADHRSDSLQTTSELSRLAHLWLAMAMLAEKLAGDRAAQPAMLKVVSELSIFDEKARIILVDNQKLRLPPQPFAILKYLYGKANQICTKDELLNNVLLGKYEENYLHTLVGRVRKLIEDDAERPRYLITEPSAGYRLITKPE